MLLQGAPFCAQLQGLPMNRIRFLALASLAICLFYASRFALYPSLGPLGMHQAETAIDLLTGKRTGKSGVGKVHVLFGDPNPAYERALLTHKAHAKRNGHPMFVCREKILSGLWTKPAFILSVVLAELAKPESERLQWLVWNDADVIVMNPEISLDIFIPPSPEFEYVNLLKTHDRHGLNNGVFFIKVNEWSVKLLSEVISFHQFRPDVELKYTEQSALEEMLKYKSIGKTVVQVPQYWFNAYPVSTAREKSTPRVHEFRAGALQIHFASNRDGKRNERMNVWLDIAEQQSSKWVLPPEQSGLRDNIAEFWQNRTAKIGQANV